MATAAVSTVIARTVQLDLFGAMLAAEQQQFEADRQRRVDALTCLRESVPEALEMVADLRYARETDTRAPRVSGDWAYCVCRRGLRFERLDEWGQQRPHGEPYGWDRTPAHLVTWEELTAMVGTDPRRAEIAAWMAALPEPRWRALYRPHELWPDAGWHISYYCHDHLDARWTGRLRSWQLVLDILSDAIETAAGEISNGSERNDA